MIYSYESSPLYPHTNEISLANPNPGLKFLLLALFFLRKTRMSFVRFSEETVILINLSKRPKDTVSTILVIVSPYTYTDSCL